MMATPAARSSFSRSKSRSTSRGVSEAVGSSRISSRARTLSARAISTSCCSGRLSDAASRSTSMSAPTRASASRACGASRGPVHARERAAGLDAQREVLGDRQIGEERRVLMDGDHAQPSRLDRREAVDGLAVDDDGAAVGRGRAGEDPHQRGLAGAVFADERVDLARAHVERGVGQRADACVGFGEVRRDEHRYCNREARCASRRGSADRS